LSFDSPPYIAQPKRRISSQQQNDFSPFYDEQDNCNILMILNNKISTAQNLCEIIVNYITNSCIGHTGVTWQDTIHELPDDDTIVKKHVGGV